MTPPSIEVATGVCIGSKEWPLLDGWEFGNCHHERFPDGQFTCYGCGMRILNRSLALDDAAVRAPMVEPIRPESPTNASRDRAERVGVLLRRPVCGHIFEG